MNTQTDNAIRHNAGPAGQGVITVSTTDCKDNVSNTVGRAPIFKVTSIDRFQMIAALKKGHSRTVAPPGDRRRKGRGYDGPAVDLEDFISKHEIALIRTEEKDGSTFYHLTECPFKPGHTDGGPALIQSSTSEITYKCFHGSCTERGWEDVRRLYETRDKEEGNAFPGPDAGSVSDPPEQEPAGSNKPHGRAECEKYRVGKAGLEMLEDKDDGRWCALASFSAVITTEVIEDDGAEKHRLYEIEVTVYDPDADNETFEETLVVA